MTLRYHPVSAAVSRGCPEPLGRFPRVTHPCAAPVLLRALDLHVLGMPPAFVLSQDQTLRLVIGASSRSLARARNPSSQANPAPKRPTVSTRCLSILISVNASEKQKTAGKPKRTQAPGTRRPRIPSNILIQISNIVARARVSCPRPLGRRGLYASPEINVKPFVSES